MAYSRRKELRDLWFLKVPLDMRSWTMSLFSRVTCESSEMKILMRDLVEGDGEVLAGALSGRKVWGKLTEHIGQEGDVPEPVFLDFSDVEVATASFLREAVLGFRDTVRQRRSNLYPVVANAGELVADELKILVEQHGDAIMLCSLDNKGVPRDPRLIGNLDPKQRITFDLVCERGETDAAELLRIHRETPEVKQNAWNNRLASLAGLGLLIELSEGRTKRYRPLLMGN
jgi:hypothetical protein